MREVSFRPRNSTFFRRTNVCSAAAAGLWTPHLRRSANSKQQQSHLQRSVQINRLHIYIYIYVCVRRAMWNVAEPSDCYLSTNNCAVMEDYSRNWFTSFFCFSQRAGMWWGSAVIDMIRRTVIGCDVMTCSHRASFLHKKNFVEYYVYIYIYKQNVFTTHDGTRITQNGLRRCSTNYWRFWLHLVQERASYIVLLPTDRPSAVRENSFQFTCP